MFAPDHIDERPAAAGTAAADDFAVVPGLAGVAGVGPFNPVGPLANDGKTLAIHKRLGERVLVKSITSITSKARERMVQAIKLARTLKGHPNVFRTLWITRSIPRQILFLVTECPDESLGAYVTRVGRRPEAQAKAAFVQVVSAVGFFHQQGIVHSALTMENVMVCDCVLKVTGFEQANRSGEAYRQECLAKSMPYCTPELILGTHVSKPSAPSTDIWALGCVLYALLAGALPFGRGGSSADTVSAILNEQPDCSAVTMSDDCCQLLLAALQKDASKRPSILRIRHCRWLKESVNETRLPHAAAVGDDALDHELYALGWGASDIEASRTKCEYSLAAAERFLLERKLRREMATTPAEQVPLSPRNERRCQTARPFPGAGGIAHHADRHDSGYDDTVPEPHSPIATDDLVVPSCSAPTSPVKRHHSVPGRTPPQWKFPAPDCGSLV